MVPLWAPVVAFVAGATCLHLGLHLHVHGAPNVHQAGLVFFLVVNVMVNFWEFALHAEADRIRREWEETRLPYAGREAQRAGDYFRSRVPLGKVLSLRTWTGIWSSYALYDPGYADRRSFGWNIDVGNGWSTLLPATLFAWGMTFEIVPARVLGIVGVAMFWQMFFGTVVYFFQFFNNGNHVGHSARAIAALVGGSNGLWLVFPLWGLWVSVALIYADSFALLR